MTSVVNCQNLIRQLLREQQTVNIYRHQYFHLYSICMRPVKPHDKAILCDKWDNWTRCKYDKCTKIQYFPQEFCEVLTIDHTHLPHPPMTNGL